MHCDNSRLRKLIMMSGKMADGAKMGRARGKTDWKTCLEGNLELFGLTSDWTTAARNASASHDNIYGRGGGRNGQGDLSSKRTTKASIRHASRETKESTAATNAEGAEAEATAPTAIDEAEEGMVANQCCAVHGAVCPLNLLEPGG